MVKVNLGIDKRRNNWNQRFYEIIKDTSLSNIQRNPTYAKGLKDKYALSLSCMWMTFSLMDIIIVVLHTVNNLVEFSI